MVLLFLECSIDTGTLIYSGTCILSHFMLIFLIIPAMEMSFTHGTIHRLILVASGNLEKRKFTSALPIRTGDISLFRKANLRISPIFAVFTVFNNCIYGIFHSGKALNIRQNTACELIFCKVTYIICYKYKWK